MADGAMLASKVIAVKRGACSLGGGGPPPGP
jgi:hypothetical protein